MSLPNTMEIARQVKESGQPVFITGASGYIGRNLLDYYSALGIKAYCLTRDEARAELIEERGGTPIIGDITSGMNDDALEAIGASSVIYHAAGINRFGLRRPEVLYETNAGGTQRFMRDLGSTTVGRVVMVSSAVTIGENKGQIATEDTKHRGWFYSDYERSKYYQEVTARAIAEEFEIDLVTVNPASVQGRRDGGTAKIVKKLLAGKNKIMPDSEVSLVDIDDCVEGMVRAGLLGKPGERYILSGIIAKPSELVAMAESQTGQQAGRIIELPGLITLAKIADGFANFIGRDSDPSFNTEFLSTVLHGPRYNGQKATQELGLEYTEPEETIRKMIKS